MKAPNKKNILFIHSDSDGSDACDTAGDTDLKNYSSMHASSPYKLQGSHRIQSDIMTRNMFQNSAEIQDYQYEAPSPPKRSNKKICENVVNDDPSGSKLTPLLFKCAEQKPIKYIEQHEAETIIQDAALNKEQAKQKEQQANRERKQLTSSIRQSSSKLFTFQIDDSEDDGDEDDKKMNQEISQSINKAVQSQQKKQQAESHQHQSQTKNLHQQQSSPSQSSSQNPKQPQINPQQATSQPQIPNPKPQPINPQINFKVTPVDMVQKSNKYTFSRKTLSPHQMLQGKILVDKFAFKCLYPQYNLIFSNYKTHIASCKKKSGSIGANYYLSLNQDENLQKDQNYLGKLRSSTTEQSVYNLFDNGDNVMKSRTGFMQKMLVATICVYISKGPRQIQIFMLKDGVAYETLKGAQPNTDISLKVLYQIEENKQCIHYFLTKKPEFNPKVGKYLLNFNGKAKQASIRNTVIEDPQTHEKVLLIGKAMDNQYNVEILSPLKPWIGLGAIVVQFEQDG